MILFKFLEHYEKKHFYREIMLQGDNLFKFKY